MAFEDAFKVEGLVTEALPNRTYRVQLANGHRVLAFRAGKTKLSGSPLATGQKVTLQMSPYDLSEGRIIGESSK